MVDTESLFSLRIVVADYYIKRPTVGLDLTYSDFRAHEIKSVPIIRIFGSNSNGEKTCMHIHGVFPYFYIPYEEKDVAQSESIAYQIASSLDKAINISLGQGSTSVQHVFKIQLVKGIPFYGYHRKEHQFLKIYLYNPRFIRRAANLFQNGAILGRIYQPHESHVPYILQFFIDYNLYGMSFLHVPKELIKYRQRQNNELPSHISTEQILDMKIERISTSENEVDIAASFILNRFQITKKRGEQCNPGIDAIWQDERLRRKNMEEENVPDLEIPKSQDRLEFQPTESDGFYRTALEKKLNESILDLSMNSTSTSDSTSGEKKRKFNLKKLLSNSVYPSEYSQHNEHMLDASIIQDHLSNESVFQTSIQCGQYNFSERSSGDESFVDEEIALSLSQNKWSQTLQQQDFDLLAVMKDLEENDQNVDLDSTLAPLSQTSNYTVAVAGDIDTENICNASILNPNEEVLDSDDDVLNDYTMLMEDVDDVFLKLTQTDPNNKVKEDFKISQLDGLDDVGALAVLRTPRKARTNKQTSPRTTRGKYTPLQIKVIRSPSKSTTFNKKPNGLPHNLDDKFINLCSSDDEPLNVKKRKLSIRNRKQSLKLLKTENPDKTSGIKIVPKNEKINKEKQRLIKNNIDFKSDKNTINNGIQPCMKTMKKCKVKIKRLSPADILKYEKDVKNSNKMRDRKKSWSPCDIAREYDRRNNFFPEPGPSHINYYELIEVPNPPLPSKYIQNVKKPTNPVTTPKTPASTKSQKQKRTRAVLNSAKSVCSDSGDDLNIYSIYEKSFIIDSPSMFSEGSSPTINPRAPTIYSRTTSKPPFANSRRFLRSATDKISLLHSGTVSGVIITPEEFPPNPRKILENLNKYNIPEIVNQEPFYGDNSDVITTRREIGHKILHIPGNSLNDCEDFQSLLPNLNGIISWRKNALKIMCGGDEPSTTSLNSANALKEYFADQRPVIITPKNLPPTKYDVKVWLKARDIILNNNKNNTEEEEEDSPIKIRREKVKLILDDEHENYSNNENDHDISQRSISLTPLTPQIDDRHRQSSQKWSMTPETLNSNLSHLKSQNNNDIVKSFKFPPPFGKDRMESIRKSRARLSLTRKMDQVENENVCTTSNISEDLPAKISFLKSVPKEKLLNVDVLSQNSSNDELSQKSNDTNDTICSDVVLKILERSSFVKNLHIDDQNSGSNNSFGISGATLNNTYGFKVNLENFQNVKSDIEHNHLTSLSLEIFVPTRGDLKPDPQHDPINCIFFSILNNVPDGHKLPKTSTGFIIIEDSSDNNRFITNNRYGVEARTIIVKSEVELLNELLNLCRCWDPDIFVGYEIEMNSWGYVLDRSKILKLDLASSLSRIPSQKVWNSLDEDREQFSDLDIETKLCGRILLDTWRLMRSEIALTSYTFENVMYHILHKRYPLHSFKNLTSWYNTLTTRWIVLEYYLDRAKGTLDLLQQLDLIGRTSELAKLFGIQFYEVLSRGSQFRVESMMLRIAKPKNLVPVSPSVQQRAHMRAPEYIPLILEPESKLYVDPVIVLDFQSLYPSMIIAYNYCFSTCLGRVEHLGQSSAFEFGASQLRISRKELKKLMDADLITSSPCGVAFVKSKVRSGVLPEMLREILDTRLMVKQSMKLHKNNSTLQRVLHSRQLGLKLIANVTYGYTSANFSGRMPSVEVGDSVVSKGRETLERAIKMVEQNENWRVKVVYGDTDSMFVLVPGRSREVAFKIGAEIAECVTNANPQPVKLKLEKVYQPCILQTKKRYVGYMYETPDQSQPVYEAKGIETVRRDGCPAAAKMLEKCLRILFEKRDVSEVKRYVCRQFTKLLSGRANIQDLLFAKEFRGKNGYKPSACVPALELTRKWLQVDPRSEPRRGERVAFLIINGPPGVPLIRLVRSPHEFLADEGLKINAIYYITKAIIPPLNRCLLLIGADVNEWFADLPRKNFITPTISTASEIIANKIYNNNLKKSTISQYFSSTNCVIDCGRQTKSGICNECIKSSSKCVCILSNKISKLERSYHLTRKICESCCGRQKNIDCQSMDCPVLFVLNSRQREEKQIDYLRNLLEKNFS